MAVEIKSPHGKTKIATLEKFEAVLGSKLPSDYRQFLLAFNGGRPENNEFAIPDIKNTAGVDLFYGLLENPEWGDLLSRRAALIDRVPKDDLPIGDASCGNVVCLSLQPATFGQVFFWDHELEADEGQQPTFSNLFLVGNSFDDFFTKLDKFDTRQVRLKPGLVNKVWADPNFKPEF